eukprot:274105-Prymnesium_polylepis.1
MVPRFGSRAGIPGGERLRLGAPLQWALFCASWLNRQRAGSTAGRALGVRLLCSLTHFPGSATSLKGQPRAVTAVPERVRRSACNAKILGSIREALQQDFGTSCLPFHPRARNHAIRRGDKQAERVRLKPEPAARCARAVADAVAKPV